jgi:hypothetical protein
MVVFALEEGGASLAPPMALYAAPQTFDRTNNCRYPRQSDF